MSSTTGLEVQDPPKERLEPASTKHQQKVNPDDPSSPDSDFPEEGNSELAVENLGIDNLAIGELVAKKIAAEKLAAEKLVAEKLAAGGLAAEKLTGEKPAAEKSEAENPTLGKPAAQELKKKPIPNGKEIGQRLKDLIKNDRKGLQKMYGETEEELNENLKGQIEKGEEMARKLITEMDCTPEVAKDLTVLTLYDVAILIGMYWCYCLFLRVILLIVRWIDR